MQKEDNVKTQGEDGRLQARERLRPGAGSPSQPRKVPTLPTP